MKTVFTSSGSWSKAPSAQSDEAPKRPIGFGPQTATASKPTGLVVVKTGLVVVRA